MSPIRRLRARLHLRSRWPLRVRSARPPAQAGPDARIAALAGLGTEPLSREFGMDRGRPIDRRYIEAFLERHAGDIRGRVLEVAERTYTERYGGGAVERGDVLYAAAGHAEATIVGDLTTGEGIPTEAFDCVILTQTLPFIYDVRAAVHGLRQALAPGGVALVTVSGISQISRDDDRDWGDWWRFTARSARRLFAEEFGAENVEAQARGNVLAAAAFLYGLADHELPSAALDADDPEYPVLVTVRARRVGT